MSFRGDPEITHEYYIKSDNIVYKIYIVKEVNYVGYSGPANSRTVSISLFLVSLYLLCIILISVHLLEASRISCT